MRINVYSQELTSEVIHVEKKSNTGVTYHAAQLILHSSEQLHHPGRRTFVSGIPCLPNGEPNGKQREEVPGFVRELWEKQGCPTNMMGLTNPYRELHYDDKEEDDDRSAVTFWLPKSPERREEMAQAFEEIAKIFRSSPTSGLD